MPHGDASGLSRDAFYPDGAEDANGVITRRRFVNVMISRPRRKAAAKHMTLPIRAVHSWGEMFAADIALELEPREGEKKVVRKDRMNGAAIRWMRTRPLTD